MLKCVPSFVQTPKLREQRRFEAKRIEILRIDFQSAIETADRLVDQLNLITLLGIVV